MSKFATVLRRTALFWAAVPLLGQPRSAQPEWWHVGTAAVDLGLAGLATGPVERVWYSPDGSSLRIHTALGRDFESSDFDSWRPVTEVAPIAPVFVAANLPEPGAQIRVAARDAARMYAFGRFVYRSEDGGRHWENVTGDRLGSIVGDGLRDLAVSPVNAEEIAVAGGAGVFRSLDGGRSWHGLNESLPNLPGAKLVSVPAGPVGPRVEFGGGLLLEWLAGEQRAWTPVVSEESRAEHFLKDALSQEFGVEVTTVVVRGQVVYVGDGNGRVSVSSDGLRTWMHSTDPRRGRVNAIWVDAADWRIALAVLASRPGTLLEPLTVLHTINGGAGWDAVSTNLPMVGVNGVTADRASNAVYVATDAGVYSANLELGVFGALPRWTEVAGLPAAHVADVRLDAGQTQLWAAVEGFGLYRTLAPHRRNDPLVVSAADWLARAAAPGKLLSVMGAAFDRATASGLDVPVLHSDGSKTEIQVPYNVTGTSLALSVSGPQGRRELPAVALQTVSPAIMELDGAPLLQDGDREIALDGSNPARSHMRVRIMAEGLGRVRPDWPAGSPTPTDNVPQVVAPVRAYLDREPVEVLRAVLWPGFTGVYMVEIEIPATLQRGLAELHLEVGGQESNRVRVYIEP